MHTRFRLRVDNQIVGFKKKMGNQWFYSKDEYAWSGKEINSTIQDPVFSFKDANAKFLYAEDILIFEEETKQNHIHLVFEEVLQTFVAVDMQTEEIRNDIFTDKGFQFTVKRISYSFIQPS